MESKEPSQFKERIRELEKEKDQFKQGYLLYKKIVDNLPLGIRIFDREGFSYEMNPAQKELLGLTDTKEETGRFNVLTDPSARATGAAELYKKVYKGETYDHEFENGPGVREDERNTREDKRCFHEHLFPVQNERGSIEFVVALLEDITEQRQKEEALKTSESKYRQLFENAPIGISQIDLQGRPIMLNKTMAQLLGFNSSEEIMKYYYKRGAEFYADPEKRSEFVQEIKKQGGVKDFEYKMKKKDGSHVWLSLTANTVESLNKPGLIIEGFAIDITERKKARFHLQQKNEELEAAEEELRASNEAIQDSNQLLEKQKTELIQYKRMVESSEDMMAAVDRGYRYLIVNNAFLKYHQLNRAQVIGYKVNQIIGDQLFKDKIQPHLDQSLKGTPVHFEMVHTCSHLGTVQLEVHYYPLEQDEGNDGVVTVIRDITQYKQAEKEKIQYFREFEITLKGLGSNQVFRYRKRGDQQWVVTFSEGEIAENYHFTTRQAKGKTLIQVMGKDEADKLKPYFDRAFEGETVEYDFQVGGRWFYTKLLPFEIAADGTVLEIIGTSTEITQRKKTEQALEESEEKHRFLFENMTQGVVYHSSSGEIIYANSSAANILGLTFDQLYGTTSVDPRWKAIHEDGSDFPGEDHPAMISLKTGKPVYNKKMGIFNPDQNDYDWININSIPKFRANQTQPYQVVATFEDITESEKNKEELRKAKEKAEESDRLKSAFLANMSHEIRTPMNGIMGFSQMLKEKDFSPDKQKKFLDIIHSSTQHLLNIINDIVDVSKIDANQLSLKLRQFNLNDVMQELYSTYMNQLENIEKKHIQLEMDLGLDHQQSCIESDFQRLRQIMDNLLSNAIKYTHKGTIQFGYQLMAGKDTLRFYVKDTGIGIPRDKRDFVFERFQQIDDSSTRAHQGTGLGLTISKNLAELLGGRMWFESQENEGSVFYFTLPYRSLNHVKPKEAPPQEEAHYNWQGKTLLIVEDDPTSQQYMRAILEPMGVKLILKQTGEEGYQAFKEHAEIDLILMDIRLPDISGTEIIQRIRRTHQKVHIIAQTAYAMGKDRDYCLQAGANDYIAKPIEIIDLLRIINQYIKE